MLKTARFKISGLLPFLLFIIFFSFRLTALDADLPDYGKTGYQQVDEGSYSYLALNKMHYGVINPDFVNTEVMQYTAPHLRTNFLENLFAYLGLQILGDNYYGLRIGSFICVLMDFALLFVLLKTLKTRYCLTENKVIWVILFSLTADFMFTVASRVVEPSTYRMLFLELLLFIYIKIGNEKTYKCFLLGLVSVFSVFGIYITNLFMVIGCFLALLYANWKKGKLQTLKSVLGFGCGGLISLLCCNTYLWYFWHTDVVENSLRTIRNFSVYDEYQTVSVARGLFTTLLHYFSNNFHLYNIAFLMLFLLSLPVILRAIKRTHDDVAFINLILYSMFLLQTLYSEDFIQRKYILIVPTEVCLIFIAYCLIKRNGIAHFIADKKKLPAIIYCLFCAFFCIGLLLYRTKLIEDGSRFDYIFADKAVILSVGTFLPLCIVLFMWRNLYKKELKNKYPILPVLFLIISVSTSLYMDLRYIYLNHTYNDRDTMIELGKMDMESPYIIGNYFLGFTLYNDYIPVVNYYEEMRQMLSENPEIFYFDYSMNFVSQEYLDYVMEGSEYQIVLYRNFDRTMKTLGCARNVALYRVEKR
ncbi:MAG: hypothetical protein NC392_15425 [Roseburia sp.]|nr:hypothetical protein [Roseburia sp.]